MRESLKSIAAIVAARDKISLTAALELVEETRVAMLEALANDGDPEEILAFELGLEPDYIFDII